MCPEGSGIVMIRFLPFSILTVLFFASTYAEAGKGGVEFGRFASPVLRRQAVERLTRRNLQRKADAWQLARDYHWRPKWQLGDAMFELMSIRDGRVYVYKTCNFNAAISIGVDKVRDTAPYNVNGQAFTVGVWDAGSVRGTHQELTGRVVVVDAAANANHSTHVAGTIGAVGIELLAEGMAPAVMIDSYEWDNDIAEMSSRAMSYPGEPDKLQISNHSYGYTCGWDYSTNPPRWYGTWIYRECDYFGMYDSEVAEWDQICYSAPYYLPFKAAGNDRSDRAPADGQIYQYYKYPRWRSKVYDSSTDPYDDGWDNGGFDTILPVSTAKNIVTVGAVYDAVSGGNRDISQATMTNFSGWGPTDDGRIKPDIVTNGMGVYSSIATTDSSYSSYNGTSAAAPSAAGTAILLIDYYNRLFPGEVMRSSTIKALMIHTADDLGKPGPDYKFGWGLVNAQAAADIITMQYQFPDANIIIEDLVTAAVPTHSYSFRWDGCSPIKATLCWTDPPGPSSNTGLDDPTIRLVNDLDLRIIGPNGLETFYPFKLDPANPDTAATTGDNVLDNVEQVLISSPAVPGWYTVRVTYKATLKDNQQYYSLIISGQSPRQLAGDLNYDKTVDFEDLLVLSEHWLGSDPSADIYPACGDGAVDLHDFAVLADTFGQ